MGVSIYYYTKILWVVPSRAKIELERIYKHVFPDVTTYCNESCRICFLARTYIALAMRPTTRTSPSAHAAADNNAGPWDGARAGDNDWFRGWETPGTWCVVEFLIILIGSFF